MNDELAALFTTDGTPGDKVKRIIAEVDEFGPMRYSKRIDPKKAVMC